MRPLLSLTPALLLILLRSSWALVAAGSLDSIATEARDQLRQRILPYWYDTAIDWKQGGYSLCDDAVQGRCVPDEKQLVSQARMVWTFSRVHQKGYSTADRDYLKAARHGVEFLRGPMKDSEHGGYFWSVTLDGKPRDPRKRLYGEAFVIYALVEYARASGDKEALQEARGLFQLLQRKAHDARHGGWMEHFERDWSPMPAKDPNAIVEVSGYKSANSHLHLQEALAELWIDTHDPEVRAALQESLRFNQTYFYPATPARSAFHFRPDWTPVTDPGSAGLSYGHNVEFAWLMLRAEEVLDRPVSWNHFRAHLDHALRYGTDAVRGGVYNKGTGNEPATDRNKVWWAQAEMLAALSHAIRHWPNQNNYQKELEKLWVWVNGPQRDAKSGIWLDTVTESGQPKSTGLAHNWKANYHDVRALLILEEILKGR
jgi:mannose/cellobiose epimerase-like protein (N-acyl-D-glucosamine 2-epimerase family)